MLKLQQKRNEVPFSIDKLMRKSTVCYLVNTLFSIDTNQKSNLDAKKGIFLRLGQLH